MQSSLKELNDAWLQKGKAGAETFAARRNLKLKDGRITVIAEMESEEAATAFQAESTQGDSAAASGAKYESHYGDLVQLSVPAGELENLAARDNIKYIREPRRPQFYAVTSEGVSEIGAGTWQAQGQTGAGVKIAILDGGFSGYQSRITSGDLPAGVTAVSFRQDGDISGGGADHGTACAEIVYDIAPGAQYYLVNFGTEVELGNAVDYLIQQGVDVISASWGFAPFRGDGLGPINDMTLNARNADILWVNSAGNEAEGHWAGYFQDANGNGFLNFTGAATESDDVNWFYGWAGDYISSFINWHFWPSTNQDYDLFLINEAGEYVAWSASDQNGTQEPVEAFDAILPANGWYGLVIAKYSANQPAWFDLYARMCDSSGCFSPNLDYVVKRGSLGGEPADSASVMTVGAVAAGSNTIEPFSSQGPTYDGRIKPDIAAPDDVSTATYGFRGFGGTSPSAPHVAGAAALMRGAYFSYSVQDIQDMLEGRALDRGDPGKDNIYGSGETHMGAPPQAIDASAPVASNVVPTGTIGSSFGTVAADLTDPGSGINKDSVTVQLDGVTLGCTVTTSQLSCPFADIETGLHAISGTVSDHAGNSSPISGSFTIEAGYSLDYYFPWYDNVYGSTWLLMGLPQGASATGVDISVQGVFMGYADLLPGNTIFRRYNNELGGPAKAAAWAPALVSERSLFGDSFEEVWATPYPELDSEYFWPFYDATKGTSIWVLAANPAENGEEIQVDLTMQQTYPQTATVQQTRVLQPGETWTPGFPGIYAKYVNLKAYRVDGDPDVPADARKVIASERQLWGSAFNEMAGIGASTLSDRYLWSWFDNTRTAQGGWPNSDMIFVGNPNDQPVWISLYIGGSYHSSFSVAARSSSSWYQSPPVMDGPVEVRGCFEQNQSTPCSSPAEIFASQAVIYAGSYDEVAGTPADKLGSSVNWTWYDEVSAGSLDWILVANPNDAPIYYEIALPGINPQLDWRAHGTLQPGDRVTPRFPGIMGGTVAVRAWTDADKTTPADVIASQRVVWKNYFNEVVGQS